MARGVGDVPTASWVISTRRDGRRYGVGCCRCAAVEQPAVRSLCRTRSVLSFDSLWRCKETTHSFRLTLRLKDRTGQLNRQIGGAGGRRGKTGANAVLSRQRLLDLGRQLCAGQLLCSSHSGCVYGWRRRSYPESGLAADDSGHAGVVSYAGKKPSPLRACARRLGSASS